MIPILLITYERVLMWTLPYYNYMSMKLSYYSLPFLTLFAIILPISKATKFGFRIEIIFMLLLPFLYYVYKRHFVRIVQNTLTHPN